MNSLLINNLSLLIAQATELDSSGMASSLFGLEGTQRFVVILTAIGCTTFLILVIGCVAAASWSAVRQREVEAELKQDMLDRGMTAEEIEQVVKAQPKEGLDHWMEVWAKKKR